MCVSDDVISFWRGTFSSSSDCQIATVRARGMADGADVATHFPLSQRTSLQTSIQHKSIEHN
eukprot:scaffold7791_cov146-Skeletonema_menzelii.AAC.3